VRKSFVKTKKSKRLDFGFRREIISGPPMLKKKFRKHFRAFVPRKLFLILIFSAFGSKHKVNFYNVNLQ
jgi:ribosomal protein L20A (L18A)